MRMKIHVAPVGSNPMDQPELYKKQRTSKIKLLLAIAGLVVLVCLACGVPAYLLTRPKVTPVQAAAGETVTGTPTTLASISAQASTSTPTTLPTRTLTPTRAATQTPWKQTQMVTRIVTQIVQLPGSVVERNYVTVVPYVITIEAPTHTPYPTYTEAPTQTPWIITVEVTPTFTETPTETPTLTPQVDLQPLPSETPSPTPTP